jgi:hypothetical protein
MAPQSEENKGVELTGAGGNGQRESRLRSDNVFDGEAPVEGSEAQCAEITFERGEYGASLHGGVQRIELLER